MQCSVIAHTEDKDTRNDLIKKTENHILEAIETSKEISNKIIPATINNFGLFTSVRNYCEEMNSLQEIKLFLNIEGKEGRMNIIFEVFLYRIIMELINNTIKYAEAKNIYINLSYLDEKNLTLFYKDDGKGFDFNKTINNPKSGMGLSNIMNRIQSLNGKCTFITKPGAGTSVKIVVKLFS